MLREPESPRANSPEDTRMRILMATRQLFASKGRRGTTTREIAEVAQVNEATLFRHFGSKDALISACTEHYCGTSQIEGFVSELSGDLEADLRAIAMALMDRMERVRDLIVMSLVEDDREAKDVGDVAWRAPAAIHRVIVEYMARRVESGDLSGDPLLLARFFMGMTFSHVIGRKKLPAAVSPEQMVDFQIGVFLNGVRSR